MMMMMMMMMMTVATGSGLQRTVSQQNRAHSLRHIAYISLQRHQLRWCTFFKPVYFFSTGNAKGIALSKVYADQT